MNLRPPVLEPEGFRLSDALSGPYAPVHAPVFRDEVVPASFSRASVLPPQRTVEWSRLSPAAIKIVQQIGLRLTAGYDFTEVAVMLEAHRDDLRHVELPDRISADWCKPG